MSISHAHNEKEKFRGKVNLKNNDILEKKMVVGKERKNRIRRVI
jgi:hypothetical protein